MACQAAPLSPTGPRLSPFWLPEVVPVEPGQLSKGEVAPAEKMNPGGAPTPHCSAFVGEIGASPGASTAVAFPTRLVPNVRAKL